MRKKTVISRDEFFSPTEIPHGRHEQGVTGIKWCQDCSTISAIEIKNFDIIYTPSITINFKSDFMLRHFLILFYKSPGGKSDIEWYKGIGVWQM